MRPVSFFFEGAPGKSDEAGNVNAGPRFLETAASVRVVRAFAEIEDRKIRQAMVALLDGFALNQRPRGEAGTDWFCKD